MEKTFTVSQIKNYIQSKDSLGDVMYYLSEEAITKANQPVDKASVAYMEGVEEYQPGKKLRNPYREDCEEYEQYNAGWNNADAETDE